MGVTPGGVTHEGQFRILSTTLSITYMYLRVVRCLRAKMKPDIYFPFPTFSSTICNSVHFKAQRLSNKNILTELMANYGQPANVKKLNYIAKRHTVHT